MTAHRLANARFGEVAPDTRQDIDRVVVALCARVAVLEARLEALTVTKAVTHAPDPVEDLKAACRDLAILVTWDGHVIERDAARLLGKAPHTLKNWRDQHQPLPFRKLGGRVQYDLADLAGFISSEPPETA